LHFLHPVAQNLLGIPKIADYLPLNLSKTYTVAIAQHEVFIQQDAGGIVKILANLRDVSVVIGIAIV